MDLVIGSLSVRRPDVMDKVIVPKYWSRLSNNLGPLTDGALAVDEVDRYLTEVDDVVVKNSVMTTFAPFLGDKTRELMMIAGGVDKADSIEITVNFPKSISAEVRVMVCKGLGFRLAAVSTVTPAHIPIRNLTPEFLDRAYDAYCLYSINEWLGHHGEALSKSKINGFALCFPRMFISGKEPDGPIYGKQGELITDPIGLALSPIRSFCDTDLMDIAMVSLFREDVYEGAVRALASRLKAEAVGGPQLQH